MSPPGVMYGSFLTETLGKENVEFIVDKDRIERHDKMLSMRRDG